MSTMSSSDDVVGYYALADVVKNMTIISEEQEQKNAETMLKLEFDKFLTDSNQPKRYFKARKEEILSEAYTFIEENIFSLLKGSLGVGKTYAACAFINSSFFNENNRVKRAYFLKCYLLKSMDLTDIKNLISFCGTINTLIVDYIGIIV